VASLSRAHRLAVAIRAGSPPRFGGYEVSGYGREARLQQLDE